MRRTAAVLVLLFAASWPAITARLYASDEVQYYAYLRSIWFDHDVSFENEYRYFYDRGVAATPGFHETFLERTTATGRRINFGTIGSALLWSPFFAAGHVAAGLVGAAQDGYSQPYITAVAVGSAVYGWLALWLGVAAARRLVPVPTWTVVAIWLGTPLLFYMYVAPPMSHACSAFAAALFLWTWLRVRRTWSAAGCAALGALAALMGMVREQDVFIAAGPALDFAGTWWRAEGREVRRRLLAGALVAIPAFAVAFLPQALAYLALNGRLGPSPLVTRKMTWTAPHALGVLASPAHGFLVWTPLGVLALAGLAWLAWRPLGRDGGPEAGLGQGLERPADRRLVALAMLAMVTVQVYVAGSVESWTVAGAFGQRRFVALTAVLVVGLAVVGARVSRRTAAWPVGVAAALAVWWNLGLMVQFGTGLMDRQRLEPARNARVTFLVLPRELPSIARRYLFDRASFYAPRRDAPPAPPASPDARP